MEIKIFYSWQSDLPNSTNRSFIERALNKAVKRIRDDNSISIEPVVDRDTSGVPGAPNIAETILAKIDACHIFVGDVSIINRGSRKRKTPNPNVLIEFGYALKKLTFSRVIMVLNKAYGKPESLPFDLKMKRSLSYHASEDKGNQTTERDKLSKRIEKELRIIIDEIEQIVESNGAKELCPLKVDLDHRRTQTTQTKHLYLLEIRLLNESGSIVKDYHIDIEFPKRFMLHAEGGIPIDERSDGETFFTRVIGKENKELYPGDSKVMASFRYYVDESNFDEALHPDRFVRVTLYVDDFKPAVVEEPFSSLQEF